VTDKITFRPEELFALSGRELRLLSRTIGLKSSRKTSNYRMVEAILNAVSDDPPETPAMKLWLVTPKEEFRAEYPDSNWVVRAESESHARELFNMEFSLSDENDLEELLPEGEPGLICNGG
jgi:hypothetical protein